MVPRLYKHLPGSVQPLARYGYMLVHPRVSWQKWYNTTGDFASRFFDDRGEFERYASEFWNSRITSIVRSAAEEAGSGEEIYDTHVDECLRLYALVRKLEPERMVETGVYHGISTATILLALAANGQGTLYSIDDSAGSEPVDDPTGDGIGWNGDFARGHPSCGEPRTHLLPSHREPGWIIPEDLRDRWDLTTGNRRRELPSLLAEIGEIDFFLHDSEHSTAGMIFEFELAWEWLSTDGVLVSIHAGWNDAFETFVEERPCDHGLMSYTFYGHTDSDIPCISAYAVKTE